MQRRGGGGGERERREEQREGGREVGWQRCKDRRKRDGRMEKGKA